MGLPCTSISSRRSTLSPARGGSGSSWSCASMSPACSALERSLFFAQAPSTSSAAAILMMLFMACLRCLRKSKVRAHRSLQLGEALLVRRQMCCEVQLVHAQLARAVEDHGEFHASGRVARLG